METFVIRLYSERHADGAGARCLRGVVEEISTGLRVTFRGSAELLAILDRSPRERSEVRSGLSDTGGVH